jgi:transcriptional regulator with XRE-family HTH domain
MENKTSLRQLAKQLGVSASYLSQVKNGKRPPSQKLVSNLLYRATTRPHFQSAALPPELPRHQGYCRFSSILVSSKYIRDCLTTALSKGVPDQLLAWSTGLDQRYVGSTKGAFLR